MTATRYLAALSATMLAAFGLVWLWVAAVPLAYLDPEYPAWLAKQQMLARCDLGELIVVGDSRAAVDILPSALPIRTTNLAVGGGSPIEASIAVARALACASSPRRVVVSFDAAHFTEPDLFWERSVRFGFVDRDSLRDLQRVSQQLDDPTIYDLRRGGLPAPLRSMLYTLRFPSFYFDSLVKGGVFLRWWRNRQALADTIATRGQYFFGTEPGSSLVAVEGRLRNFTVLPVLDHYFDQMLSQLAARGIDVDFIAMPMNDTTWQAMRPQCATGSPPTSQPTPRAIPTSGSSARSCRIGRIAGSATARPPQSRRRRAVQRGLRTMAGISGCTQHRPERRTMRNTGG